MSILLAEVVRIHRLFSFATAIHAIIFHFLAVLVIYKTEEGVGIHLFAIVERDEQREVSRLLTACDTGLKITFVTQHIEAEQHAVVDVLEHSFRQGAQEAEIAPFVESEAFHHEVKLTPKLSGFLTAFGYLREIISDGFLFHVGTSDLQLRVDVYRNLSAVEIQQDIAAVVDGEFFRFVEIFCRQFDSAVSLYAAPHLIAVGIIIVVRHREGMRHLRQFLFA